MLIFIIAKKKKKSKYLELTALKRHAPKSLFKPCQETLYFAP